MAELFPPVLSEMIHEVERELAQRDRVYRLWIANGKMKQETADKQIARMRAVLANLQAQRVTGNG